MNPVQSTLKHLDLSGNRISTISDSQLNQVKIEALRALLKHCNSYEKIYSNEQVQIMGMNLLFNVYQCFI